MALEQCEDIIEPEDIPCLIVTTWDYPDACNLYTLDLYNESGDTIQSFTMGDIGIYCNTTFNYTNTGQYYYNISSGDTGSILVGAENLMLIGQQY